MENEIEPKIKLLPYRYTYNSKEGIYTIRQSEHVGKGETTAVAVIVDSGDQQKDELTAKLIVKSCNNHIALVNFLKHFKTVGNNCMTSAEDCQDKMIGLLHTCNQLLQHIKD